MSRNAIRFTPFLISILVLFGFTPMAFCGDIEGGEVQENASCEVGSASSSEETADSTLVNGVGETSEAAVSNVNAEPNLIPEDLNGDGLVDWKDLMILMSQWYAQAEQPN